MQAKFSKLAIWGALWIPFFFVAFFGMYWSFAAVSSTAGGIPSPSIVGRLLSFTLLPLGVLAPLGTTILGSMALSRIRRSNGSVIGLPLALADTLFFPLLAMDVLLVLGWVLLTRNIFPQRSSGDLGPWLDLLSRMIVYGLPILIALGLDVAIAFWSWRAARKPLAAPGF